VIDIHCHIAPGLDDGSQDLATSLVMAERAAADGIRVIIATPHTNGVFPTPERLALEVGNLNREISSRRLSVVIVPGFEIPHSLALDLAATHTLAGSGYLLIEFPHAYLPAGAVRLITDLVNRGYQPIIAHPERNGDVLAAPGRLVELVEAGAQIQLTAASVTGDFGPDCQRCAHYLLTRGLTHYIATDSHSPSFRTPVLRKARTLVEKLLGPEQAALLTDGNPLKIVGDLAAPAE